MEGVKVVEVLNSALIQYKKRTYQSILTAYGRGVADTQFLEFIYNFFFLTATPNFFLFKSLLFRMCELFI